MSKLNASIEYLKKFGKNTKSEEIQKLMGPKYEKFIEEQTKKPTVLEYIT